MGHLLVIKGQTTPSINVIQIKNIAKDERETFITRPFYSCYSAMMHTLH